MFQEGVKIFPKSVKLWYEWGQKYLRKGELEKAKKNLEKVLELCSGRFNTNPSEVMVDLGNINIKQGKEEEARELYLEALWLTPETHLRLEREGLLTEEELKDLDKNRKKRTTQEYYQKTGRRYIEEEKQREKAIEINKNDY
ncbi:MAG: tetratricopeptide repeat protein [Candidatus Heimdallarchaeota archaeon]|nr:tetratricopeptide repeat protein [Candidatus Heimdallarchaeota archaeon]